MIESESESESDKNKYVSAPNSPLSADIIAIRCNSTTGYAVVVFLSKKHVFLLTKVIHTPCE